MPILSIWVSPKPSDLIDTHILQDIKHRLPAVEAQHKVAARSAQLLAKDSVRAGGAKALSTITTTEAQLHQVCAMFANLCYIINYIISIWKTL